MSYFDEEAEEEPPCVERADGGPCIFQEDDKNAEMVCKLCGRVGRRILSTAQAKVFEHDDVKNLHADEGKSLGIEDTRMGSIFTSNVTGLNPGLVGRDRTLQFTVKKKAKDKTAEAWRHDLEDQCARMMLKGKTTNDCVYLFDEYVREAPTLPKKKKTAIMLGVIFYACTKNDDQRTIQELARQTGTTEKDVRAGMKLIEKRCHVFQDKRKVEPIDLIPRYCHKMNPDFKNLFLANARVVAEYIHQYLEGKKPKTVAATDILLTYKWFYKGRVEWNEDEIAEMAKLKTSTLKASVAKVEEDMKNSGRSPAEIIADAESRHPTE